MLFPDYHKFLQNPCRVLQVSFPRSGRTWLSSLICNSAKCQLVPVDYRNGHQGYDWDARKLAYYTAHWQRGFLPNSNTRFVLLVRDPRDAILSVMYYARDVNGRNLFGNSKRLKRECLYWKLHIDTMLNQKSFLMMQYERLLLYPASSVQRILDFAGFVVKKSIYDVIVKDDRSKFGEVMTGKDRYTKQALGWILDTGFTKIHKDIIWDILGDTMIRFGYTENGQDISVFNKEPFIKCS